MSRVSDTRQRTREAAAQLVAGGKRPHEITVDQIYAAIQQGSRTTINDELKQWKDERTKADALGADLPAVVADAMRALWVAAVEQGEALFTDQRGTLETALADAEQQQAAVSQARNDALATSAAMTEQCEALRQQVVTLQVQLESEVTAKNQALQEREALQQKLSALQTDTAEQIERIRQAQTVQAEEFQATIASRDAAFQVERDTANERLEIAQARMLLEIDAAREGQRRAEQQMAKMRERLEQQQASLAGLRMEAGHHRRELADRDTQLVASVAAVADRDRLAIELAAARGRLDGLGTAMQSLETRATTAESRLTALLAERASPATARSKRGKQQNV